MTLCPGRVDSGTAVRPSQTRCQRAVEIEAEIPERLLRHVQLTQTRQSSQAQLTNVW